MTPDIEWKAKSALTPAVFNSFSQMLAQAHTGWNFESVKEKSTRDTELLAYVKKYSLGESYLTDILALPISGFREGDSQNGNYIVVSYVVEGNDYKLDINEKHYSLNKGNIFIWNTSQNIYFKSREMVRQISIFLPLKSPFNLKKLDSKETIFVIDQNEAISNILRSAILTLRKNSHKICTSDECFIINPIIDLTKSCIVKSQALSSDKKRNSNQVLDEIRDYVNNNLFDSDLSIANISQTLGISKRYIHQVFSQEPLSLSCWITQLRLEQAAKYLRDTKYRDISITDIAMMVGFNDSSYFSKKFKTRFGTSPRRYR